MPYPLASLTKRGIRADVAYILGDNWPFTTTTGGSSTTAIISSLIGVPIAAIQNKYLLLESGTSDSEYRIASQFAPLTGTITTRRAFTNTVAISVSGHIHEFSPHLYTLGINEAIRVAYPALYRPILFHQFTRYANQRALPLPRDMDRILTIEEDKSISARVQDFFDRTASTTDPGTNWTAITGTWGITSESLYCPSDTDGDFIKASTNYYLQDGVIEFRVRGDTTNTASRTLLLAFRVNDDYTEALGVRLLNDTVDLRKLEGGSWTSLSTGTVTTTEDVDYVVRVQFEGSWVSVWVNDRQYILFELVGTNLKYLGYDENPGTYGNFGFRLEKTGSPSLTVTSTRVSHIFAHALVGTSERGDWALSMGGRSIEMRRNHRGRDLTVGKMLWMRGLAELSQVAADTTFEALTTDGTATVEMLTTDPAYEVLTQWAAYEVLNAATQMAFTSDPAKRQEYQQLAQNQLQRAQVIRRRNAMRYPARMWV